MAKKLNDEKQKVEEKKAETPKKEPGKLVGKVISVTDTKGGGKEVLLETPEHFFQLDEEYYLDKK